jgi:hypothetical protein
MSREEIEAGLRLHLAAANRHDLERARGRDITGATITVDGGAAA